MKSYQPASYRHQEAAKVRLWGLLVFAAVVGVCSPVLNGSFILLDDPGYVTGNSWVSDGLSLDGIIRAFTLFEMGNWHPVTWLSHMLDVELFGLVPLGHHLTSLVLHGASTVLLFRLLMFTTGHVWPSVITALLFGIHPLRIESVAWIAERKDVLSIFFGLLAMLMYVRYTKCLSSLSYGMALLFFSLGLMSKPMLVTMPVLMLLWDYWPLGRWPGSLPEQETPVPAVSFKRLMGEKFPFLILAGVSVYLTLAAQGYGGSILSREVVPVADRFSNALVAYAFYLGKTFWPTDLAVFYPFRFHALSDALLPGVILTAVTAAAFHARRRNPAFLMGWLWFLLSLTPVIGFVQVGLQAWADRYTYLPHIGLFIALVWLLYGLFLRTGGSSRTVWVLLLPPLVGLAAGSYVHAKVWKDDETLFRHAISVTSGNYQAYNKLGVALALQKREEEAEKCFMDSLRHAPGFVPALVNLGHLLIRTDRGREAASWFEEALRIQPRAEAARIGLAKAYVASGKNEEALAVYLQNETEAGALRAGTLFLAETHLEQGAYGEALIQYKGILEMDADDAKALYGAGLAAAGMGRLDEAASYLAECLRNSPDFTGAKLLLEAIRQTGAAATEMVGP